MAVLFMFITRRLDVDATFPSKLLAVAAADGTSFEGETAKLKDDTLLVSVLFETVVEKAAEAEGITLDAELGPGEAVPMPVGKKTRVTIP